MLYFLPVIVIIVAATTYQISAKQIPKKMNHFAGLVITYSCLALVSFIIFSLSSGGDTMADIAIGINQSVFLYGIAAVGIETGYIFLFRAGWNISLGGVVCNIMVAVSMIAIGLAFFGESLTIKQIIGICLCIIGLILINRGEISSGKAGGKVNLK